MMVGGVFSTMRTVARNNPKMMAVGGLAGLGASVVASNPNQKSNHTVAKTVVGIATVVAALALGNKLGLFTKGAEKLTALVAKFGATGVIKKGADFVLKALGKLDSAGAKIVDVAGKAVDTFKNTKIGGQIIEKGEKFISETVAPYAKKGFDFVKGLFTGIAKNADTIA